MGYRVFLLNGVHDDRNGRWSAGRHQSNRNHGKVKYPPGVLEESHATHQQPRGRLSIKKTAWKAGSVNSTRFLLEKR